MVTKDVLERRMVTKRQEGALGADGNGVYLRDGGDLATHKTHQTIKWVNFTEHTLYPSVNITKS